MEIVLQIFILAAGFIMLAKGADLFVEGAAGIASKLGIPQIIIGLTIVAMGTSMPEAAVSISSALMGSADITVGNIIGSNLLNILLILGATAVITPLPVAKSTVRTEIPFVIFLFLLFILFGADGAISQIEGAIFWVIFAGYLVYLFILSKRTDTSLYDDPIETGLPAAVLSASAGIMLIPLGSSLAVNSATELAAFFGMSERFIGLTIVSLGTTLPELVTSVTAALKGKPDIAIGNIAGSCVFNILFVAGASSLVTDLPFASAFLSDAWISVLAAAFLLICCFRTRLIGRRTGAALLGGYLVYFISVLLQ